MGNKILQASPSQQLFYSIERNDVGLASSILQKNPQLINVSLTKDSNHNPLMRAAYNGSNEMVDVVLKTRGDINAVNNQGDSALMIAIKRAHNNTVKLLLRNGARTNIVSRLGLTSLDYAILNGLYSIAFMVLYEANNNSSSIGDGQARLGQTESLTPKSIAQYEAWSVEYRYRYVNFQIVLNGLANRIDESQIENFHVKMKRELNDPVLDPNEPWSAWIKRVVNFKEPPLVERQSLPVQMQPQNRTLGKVHHFLHKLSGPLPGRRLSLQPLISNQVMTEVANLKENRDNTDNAEVMSN